MRFLHSLTPALLLLAAGVNAASSWSFDDASVSVASKSKDDVKQKLSEKSPLKKAVELSFKDTLKVSVTTKENGKAKRPHQAFLILKEAESGLEAPFPLTLKESGKGVVEISQKDLPVQHLLTTKPLQASIVIGSFGTSQALDAALFDIDVKVDPNTAAPLYEKPLRYGKQPEINHIFRSDPDTPYKIFSVLGSLAILVTIPGVVIAWAYIGGNVDDLQKALNAAPISHSVFFGSILAMEGVFFLYYSSWNLFQTLPIATVVAVVTFFSGAKALGEVQSRRLAGER